MSPDFTKLLNQRFPKKELPSAFTIWWDLAQSVLPPDTDRDECLFLFSDAYDKAKTPLGSNVIMNAINRVKSSSPPPQANNYQSPKIRQLVHLCYELQIIAGENPFFLSVRSAARAIDCNGYVTAAAFLNGLVRDGILECVERGKPGGRRCSSSTSGT